MPSRWMTQAPHCEVSQPTCVPVRRRFSRRNCTSRVRSSTFQDTALPFTVIDTAGMGTPPDFGPFARFFISPGKGADELTRNPADFVHSYLGTGLSLNPGDMPGQGRILPHSSSNRGDRGPQPFWKTAANLAKK